MTTDLTINDMTKQSHEMSRAKGWYDGEATTPKEIRRG